MKIVLTGFMATGKTSVGKVLAQLLDYPLIDTDELIVEREGMPISQIFKEKGESYFRDVERAVIRDVSDTGAAIISPGGGAIKDKRNVDTLGHGGIIICLQAEPEVILKRVESEKGIRPLLDVEDSLRRIKEILKEREHLYAQADMMIDTSTLTPENVAQRIIHSLALNTETVTVSLGERSYPVVIGTHILPSLGLRIKEFRPSKVVVITNPTVMGLYGKAISDSFNEFKVDFNTIVIPDGELYKDLYWASYIYGELLRRGLDRSSLIVALGGGVIGDIAGFTASTFMRGIRYIQVPTTLLGQVDSSVGGKTAVNHPLGKNMIGSFWQPSFVLIDGETLKTFPQREFTAALAEVIKYGVIRDSNLFDFLETQYNAVLAHGKELIPIIKRCCEIKADVVSHDEREGGLRAILNFGHTVGHGIETVTGYAEFLHGEAISIGMCAASELSYQMGMLSEDHKNRIINLIRAYGLPTILPAHISSDLLMDVIARDKKFISGKFRLVLPLCIGTAKIVDSIDSALLRHVLVSMVRA
jgi:3-dehydroquinate synthase